jgi:hypothetical protein
MFKRTQRSGDAVHIVVRIVVLAAALFACMPVMADELSRFLGERAAYAKALSEPIAVCVAKRDTEHPVFRGCIDWHSSVHGVWALSAYARFTGDRRHDAMVQALLSPEGLAEERAYLNDHPAFEMPYGRAWFLRLAIDYKRAFGDARLDDLARDVAQSLLTHYSSVAPNPESTAYGSATWALINLHDYAAFVGDQQILSFVEDKVRAFYLSREPCPLQRVEVATREFMAVCTNWAWLVGKVLPRKAFKAWLATFLPLDLEIEPIADAASVHQAGLNFSRAWGLWALYRTTGERRFLKAYLRHFDSTFARPDIWNGDYGRLSHWVAQFGMLALRVTYDDPPRTQTGAGP